MRLWTIHPGYLDTRGLLAAWREGLLAQKVLRGETRGYRNHPQLSRFRSSADPLGAIAKYLSGIYGEAVNRAYKFDGNKIAPSDFSGQILCTRGQLLYEWRHLKEKLKTRDAVRHDAIKNMEEPEPHPLFKIVEGEVEAWEVINGRI
ncbi:MAG TPA: pyrimidine dimer DNA glycosylase/endonuclease V [Pyrinomonadaceae bacterium]|jgi:hypothetical protein|nr:pyrimidine dimer DNA glycosylase/endonuclease V [Pyrinomonadaceae bacterium]